MHLKDHPKLINKWPPDVTGKCFEEGLSVDDYMKERPKLILDAVERREVAPKNKSEYSYYISLTFKNGDKKCTSTIYIKKDQEFLDQLFAKLAKVKGKSISEIGDLEWEDI